VAGFLAAKPADISERCPLFEATGNTYTSTLAVASSARLAAAAAVILAALYKC
jgi:hypothetical protein